MTTERKNIFSRSDVWAILFLLACLLLGGAIMMYQKSNRKIPPELLIETVSKSTAHRTESGMQYKEKTSREALKINLNTAPADSLELIPGIGPVFAKRIVEYRDANGSFREISDLTEIEGIGIKSLENIKEYLTLE